MPPAQRVAGRADQPDRRGPLPGRRLAAAGRRQRAVARRQRPARLRPRDPAPRPMKRLLAIAAVLLAGIALVVFATGSSSDSGGVQGARDLRQRRFVIPGEDVQDRRRRRRQHLGDRPHGRQEGRGRPQHRQQRLPGLPQGRLLHDPPAVADRREVRRVRADAAAARRQPEAAAAADRSQSGPGEGEYLLPATNTARSVDLDLINNIMRLPFRQRFTIFLNEFGTGLAGNGAELQAALQQVQPGAAAVRQRARDPRRAEQDARAARRRRRQGAGAARARARAASRASSTRRPRPRRRPPTRSAALEENFALLPQFLRELVPTMNSLANFSTQALPVAEDLGGAATSINTFVTGTPEFAAGRRRGAHDARRHDRRRGPGAARSRCRSSRTSARWQARPSRWRRTSRRCCARCSTRAGSTASRRHLLPRRRDERLRPVRPLRARAARADDLHDVRARQNQLGCTANFRKDFGAVTTPALPTSGGTPSASDARRAVPRRSPRARGDRRQGARAARSSCPGRCCPVTPACAAAPAPRRRRLRARQRRAGREVRPVPPRLPPRPMRRRGGGRLDRGEPGADRRGRPTLVVIVAVFLAYNANTGPAVRADLRPQGRGARTRPASSTATRCASAARASAPSRDRRRRRGDGTVTARARPEARDASSSRCPTTPRVMVRPRSALGLKYVELTRGTVGRRTCRERRTIPLSRRMPTPGRDRRVLQHVRRRRRGAAIQANLTLVRQRVRRPRRRPQLRDPRPRPAARRPRRR